MTSKRESRLKRVAFSVANDTSKYQLIAMMRKLPNDAELVRVGNELADGCDYMVFYSSEWDLVPEGQLVPYFSPWISWSDLEDARTQLVDTIPNPLEWVRDKITESCICDLAYTGERYHRTDCPIGRILKLKHS